MQKAIRYTVMILLVAISFFGILGPILNSSKPLPPHLVNFGKTQALEDYDTMWRLIEENYPFLLHLSEQIGMDAQKVKATYREQLTAKPTVTVDTFYTIITNCLKEFQGVGHMQPLSPTSYAGSMANWEANSPESKKTDATFFPLLEENTKAFYAYLGTSSNGGNTQPPDFQNLHFTMLDEKTAYLEILSFNSIYIKKNQAEMADFWQEVHNIPNVIIDIRKNGGGSSTWWTNSIVSPNITETLSVRGIFLLMDGEINRQRYGDYFAPEAQDLSEFESLPAIHLPTLAQMDYAFSQKIHIQPTGTPETIYPGKIYLLVGNYVYSASEMLAYVSKDSGFATLVGTQTGGDGAPGGGTMAFVSLPNSGMIFRMQTSYTLNPDGSSNTLYGTTPHVVIGPEEDALEVCRRLIAEK